MKRNRADDDLDQFLSEALRVQAIEKDEPITEERLKAIAKRCGYSEEEWDRLCRELEDCTKRGRRFLEFENPSDAVVELEKAVALAPYRADLLADCGRAHALLWQKEKVKASRARSLELFTRALETDAGNEAAARGLSDLRNERPWRPPGGKRSIAVAASAAGALAAAAVAILMSLSPPPGAENPTPEMPESHLPAPELANPGANLPHGAVLFGDRAFLIVLEDIPWHEAKRRCEELGGRLAVVKDFETLEFINEQKKMKRLWLGATDEHNEGDWRWIDGTEVAIDAWSDRQPFNLFGMEHYMEIGPNGRFNDVSADGPTEKYRINGFICEWDIAPEARTQSLGMTVGGE